MDHEWGPKMTNDFAQVVEMRYFAGLTEPEIALALGITERTVRRDWQKVACAPCSGVDLTFCRRGLQRLQKPVTHDRQ